MMKPFQIDSLINRDKSPCISIIIPTDRINASKNYELLKKSIKKAKALLLSKALPEDVTKELISKIDMSSTRIPETVSEGLGFFISQAQYNVVTFPFKVKHKVIVDNSFSHRDLFYLKQYSTPYYVLNLSKRGVHLLKGNLDELDEIKNEKFPLLYEDQFEYEPASAASSNSNSLKGYEKEKTQITEIRLRSVFRDADASVKPLLSDETKLLLAGTQKMISLFAGVTTLGDHLNGKVTGSYDENNIQRLRENAWSAFCRISKKEIARQVEDLQEKRNGHLAEGIRQAWAAAIEGKGLMLVVEKDFHHLAYRKEGLNRIQLQPPEKPYAIIPDAVEDVIEAAYSKKGKLVFTENGQLKEFDHVALVLRY